MANDNIDFVEEESANFSREAMPRQIKTRKSSFESIVNRYKDFMIERKSRKLDKVVYGTISDTYTENDLNDVIMKRSLLIARLENKIKILSGENVPYNYVSKRAIKLRNKMMDRVVFNSDGIYSIYVSDEDYNKAEKSVDLFDNPSNVSIDIPTVVENNDGENIQIDSSGLDRDSISDVINDSFADVETNNNVLSDESKEVSFISPEQVKEFVGDKSDEIVNSNTEENTVVDDQTDYSGVGVEVDVPPVESDTVDEIKNEDNKSVDDVKVSRSEATFAKIDKYDSDGNIKTGSNFDNGKLPFEVSKIDARDIFNPIKKFEFTLSKASENEQVSQQNSERDFPVVVEDRVNYNELDNSADVNDYIDSEKSDDDSISISDDIDLTGGDAKITLGSVAGKISEYSQLRDRALELKRKKQIVNKNRDDVQLSAEKIAQRAAEVKRIAQQSQSDLDRKIEELRDYCFGLEKDCDEVEKATEVVENDIKMNNNFIAMQEGKTEENSRIIEEIDLLMSGESLIDEQNKKHI